MLISCMVNIAANCVLIPCLHAVGAALATLASEVINMLLYYRYSRDYIRNAFTGSHPIPIAGAAAVAGAVCWFGKSNILQEQPLLQMILFLGIFLIIYCLLVCAVSRDAKVFAIKILKATLHKVAVSKKP